MGSVEPSPERFEAFRQGTQGASPLLMLNLLRYRERAAYPEGSTHEPCSGREACHRRYGPVAAQQVAAVGGRIVWAGEVLASVIAPDGEEWDDAVLVEYPSREALLEMLSRPAYQAAVPHRSAALEDSRLIATRAAAAPGGEGLPR